MNERLASARSAGLHLLNHMTIIEQILIAAAVNHVRGWYQEDQSGDGDLPESVRYATVLVARYNFPAVRDMFSQEYYPCIADATPNLYSSKRHNR